MLKQITRRRKKYLFLDLLIIISVGIYLRIRIMDMQFFESLQSQYLWLYTIIIALLYHPIGRIQCILLMIIINYISLYMLNTQHILLAINLYRISNDSLYLLIASLSMNVFRNKFGQALFFVLFFGGCTEFINIFINLHFIKNMMIIIIIVLCILRLLCRKLPQSNYFYIISQLFDIKISMLIFSFIITGYITLYNIPQYIELMISSSSCRFIIPLFLMFTYFCILDKLQNIREEQLFLALCCSTLLLFDNFIIAFLLTCLLPFLVIIQLFNFVILQNQVSKKVLQDKQYNNYDLLVIINYFINQFCYNTYQQTEQFKIHIYIVAIILFSIMWYKERKISTYIRQKYEQKTYDQFESARNDDTVL